MRERDRGRQRALPTRACRKQSLSQPFLGSDLLRAFSQEELGRQSWKQARMGDEARQRGGIPFCAVSCWSDRKLWNVQGTLLWGKVLLASAPWGEGPCCSERPMWHLQLLLQQLSYNQWNPRRCRSSTWYTVVIGYLFSHKIAIESKPLMLTTWGVATENVNIPISIQ